MEDQSYPSMDVDDLFGDAEQVTLPNISVISAPPVKGLEERLDELSTSGCCSRIAWSKSGCVAYITPDRYAVHLRVFSRDTSTGKWDLGKATPIDIPVSYDEYPFLHVSWSNLGNDLAVINAAGQVMIFTCSMVLDRMTFMRSDLTQPEVDMDKVVGMHWLAILPYEHKNQIAWSASKNGDKWAFNVTPHAFKDMHHPAEGKASLIYLKGQGDIKLRFQQPDSSWQEVTAPLSSTIATRDAFTHAAFASNNDSTLLLAAYDVSGRVHLYRIEAKWNVPPPKAGQPPPRQYDKPELTTSLLTIADDGYPTMVNTDPTSGVETKVRIPAQLTHLNFLPTTPEQNDGSLPTIQAIFSTPPSSVHLDQTQPPQNHFSIVTKWEVHHQQKNQLHSSLDKVTSKKKSVSSICARNAWALKRQQDTMMHSIVLSFVPVWYSMILSFIYSDGTIEFRKRSTMATIAPDYAIDAVTSMPQAGFSFTAYEPALYTALSPNHCIAVCMQTDGKIKLRSMDYTYGTLSTPDPDPENDPRHSAALAALILQSTTAANQYFTSDDIFSVIGTLSQQRKDEFISLMFQSLAVSIDCGIDEQSSNHLILLGRSPFFVKTLSAIHLLGLEGSLSRSLSSKTAWIILNIKYITQILTTIARMHVQIEKNPLRPEAVPYSIGICRWIMHFITYMMDELLELSRTLYLLQRKQNAPLTKQALESAIQDSNKPALLVLLSAFPRTMLKLWTQPLSWVSRTAVGYINGNPTPEIHKLYLPLHTALFDSPADFRQFEHLVSEAQALVRQCYKRDPQTSKDGKEGEAARNKAERELLAGRIPDVLWPAAQRLVTESLWGPDGGTQNGGGTSANHNTGSSLADKVDVAKLTFFDTTWLGFTASKRAEKFFEDHVVDVCQKMVIRGPGAQSHPVGNQNGRIRSGSIQSVNGVGNGEAGIDDGSGGRKKDKERKLRRCTRCGACMEDVVMGMPGYANPHVGWLMGVAKHCVCGNSWMLAPGKV
ncbi:hypothetical protein P280DRAFT_454076 [Massarina eburnea CBS 473.64]|uniref:Mediator of RNA polymerase II transcription subunit 16 n=1 Tax=Massarina eburnea CBS 473.64 TaxID=1395130 RepID=A0A6A6S0Z0_9PLEO|nr:hypothetical protein P280DRAFT_454076 [Massarina eburnea CBS 473.64]